MDVFFPSGDTNNTYVTLLPYGMGSVITDGSSNTAHRKSWIVSTAPPPVGYFGLRSPFYEDEFPTSDINRFDGLMGPLSGSFDAGSPSATLFAVNDKTPLVNEINASFGTGSGVTPIVSSPATGIMWAWMALSPKWQGAWDLNRSVLPSAMKDSSKWVVLIAGDKPNLDSATVSFLCDKMTKNNINIMVISYGNKEDVSESVKHCVSKPSYYIHAPETSPEDLKKAIATVGDTILSQTTRLSK
jgi:hypothetical protein